MPKEFPGASYDAWKTTNPDDQFLGPEPEEEEKPSCGSCRLEFADPPAERNIERFKGGDVAYTCDACLEEYAMDRAAGPEYVKPEED